MTITFETTEVGVAVEDDIERRRHELETAADEARRVDTDRLHFPVDAAVAVPTDELVFPTVVATYVRDAEGEMLGEIDQFGERAFPPGRYSVELCASIKFYIRVDGRLTVDATDNRTRIATDADEIVVGARSHHERPEATITTTGDPTDLMVAVTALSSALKTTSPERSYPTLRGHPPTIELGDELHVPDALEAPETGITLELPPSRGYVYPAASLAYYLGARVVPGPSPRLVTDEGFEYRLDGPGGYEATVERTLKQTFFLDCLTRTEGYYTVDLHEREAVEDDVDLDFAALYDASPAERLEAYLGVPFDCVEPEIPEWKLTTHVDTDADQAELLPFLVRDLATVRLPAGTSVAESGQQVAGQNQQAAESGQQVAGQNQQAAESGQQAAAVSEFTRSASSGTAAGPSGLVEPATTDSIEQAWAGDDVPVGASKASVQAFRNRLDRDVSDGDIDIAVVCNDDAMGEERSAAEEVYGSRESLPFDIHVYHDLSTAALRAVVETDVDFLHYIGHIDDEGFDCADGKLDARELEFVGVDAFLLNACVSYEQGMALIDRGAIGGVVTLSEVNNSGAVRVGRAMSRLLNQGFPLRAALDIAKDRSVVGGQYIVVGDGNVDVVQLETSQPMLCRIDSLTGDRFDVTFRAYPTESRNMGTMTTLLVDEGTHYLGSGEVGTFTLDREELWQVVSQEAVPLLVDGEFTWSDEVDLAGL